MIAGKKYQGLIKGRYQINTTGKEAVACFRLATGHDYLRAEHIVRKLEFPKVKYASTVIQV